MVRSYQDTSIAYYRRGILVLMVACLFVGTSAVARVADNTSEETEFAEFESVRVAGPFEFPWSFAFLPDHAILLTERPGRLHIMRPSEAPREVMGLPAMLNEGLAGLLDVAIDPDFSRKRYIYLSYVHGTGTSSSLRVMRARLDVARRKLTQRQVIFEAAESLERNEQYGGRLAVTRDGFLFLSIGDRWESERAQDLGSHVGKIIRIRTDGAVPPDNPFVGLSDVRPEIWSYGHRNPQGLVYEETAGRLWSHEHGPMGGDELNLIQPGRNYGWPVITHGLGYDHKPVGEGSAKEGMEQPFHPFGEAVAPSGLAVEASGPVTVFWIGTLAGQSLFRLEAENGRVVRERRLLHEDVGRIRDVRIGPDGLLYVITDDAEGALYRLDPVQEQAGAGRNRGRL